MHAIARKILLLVAAGAALSAAGCAASQLEPGDYNQVSPSINGGSVVWEDSRNDATDGTDIYMFDNNTETLVAGGNGDQQTPRISSSYIVWLDSGRLVAKDRTSGAVFNVTNGPATQADPVLCGSVVAWTDTGNNSDVYARDLAGGAQVAVAASSAVEAYPACDAGRVVYMYAPTGQFASIRLYDLATGATTVVASDPWNDWQPAISGNLVVWQAWPNQPDTINGIQIMGKNLGNGHSFTVTSGPNHQTAPVISGSAVAWEDLRSGTERVWWRDLQSLTGERRWTIPSPVANRNRRSPGRFLAFENDSTTFWNIYTAFVPRQCPCTTLP